MKKKIIFLKVVIIGLILIMGGTACMESSNNPETSYNYTSSNQPSESTRKTDKQIVEVVYSEICGDTEMDDVDFVDEAMSFAEKLPDRYLGSISSEEDVKQKAETAWIQIEEFKHATSEKPYTSQYYNQYDVWLVSGNPPLSGVDSNDRLYATPGGVLYIIIRNSDGKVLAIWGDC